MPDELPESQLLRISQILSDISGFLNSANPEDLIQMLPEKACELLSVPICIIWKLDPQQQKFKVVATAGKVDEDYKKTELDVNHPGVWHLFKKNEVLSLLNVADPNQFRLSDFDKLDQQGWISLLSAPIRTNQKIIGVIDLFTEKTRHFKSWEKKLLRSLADYACSSFEKADLVGEKKKLQELTETMLDVTKASDRNELFDLLLEGARKLVSDADVIISELNYGSGTLDVVRTSRKLTKKSRLKLGDGISGKALEMEKTINVGDVKDPQWKEKYIQDPQWKGKYIQDWEDTRSELAVPILIDEVPVRIGNKVETEGSKRIGILNVQSQKTDGFSKTDKESFNLLVRVFATRLERIEYNSKLEQLRQREREIGKEQNYEQIIKTVIKGITEILKFEWVNISLVDPQRTRIESKYIAGLPDDQAENFKRQAVHSLSSSDIQADIVRSKQIEVPEIDDNRFDQEIFDEYGHKKLIRAYIPMIEQLSNQVVGTVEVGYKREYLPYIYEQDIQILKRFVDDAVNALERRKSGIIDVIAHELKSPIVGIKDNASFLQRRFNELGINRITIKLDDIIKDSDLLLYQVREIEYFMGKRASQPPKFEQTVVFRDIIIKTVNQIKPHISALGFSLDNIKYNSNDSRRIIVDTDKNKLNQVVFNLLNNSLKYAERDPDKFKIVLEVEEGIGNFIIKFQDWGIGINEKDKNKIFDQGFRSPEAIAKDVVGAGIGLSISRDIMKQLKGDLKLVKNQKPTEFHLILPKNIQGGWDDSFC